MPDAQVEGYCADCDCTIYGDCAPCRRRLQSTVVSATAATCPICACKTRQERTVATATNEDGALAVLADVGGGSKEAGGAVVAGSIAALIVAVAVVAGAAALIAVAANVVARQRRRAAQNDITMVALELTGSHLEIARGVPIARDLTPQVVPPPPPAGSPGAPSSSSFSATPPGASVSELPTAPLINPLFAAANPMAMANLEPEGRLSARVTKMKHSRPISIKPTAGGPASPRPLSAAPPAGAQTLKVSSHSTRCNEQIVVECVTFTRGLNPPQRRRQRHGANGRERYKCAH